MLSRENLKTGLKRELPASSESVLTESVNKEDLKLKTVCELHPDTEINGNLSVWLLPQKILYLWIIFKEKI